MISKEAFIAGFAYGGTTVVVGQPYVLLFFSIPSSV